jgi:hypothetical protein
MQTGKQASQPREQGEPAEKQARPSPGNPPLKNKPGPSQVERKAKQVESGNALGSQGLFTVVCEVGTPIQGSILLGVEAALSFPADWRPSWVWPG